MHEQRLLIGITDHVEGPRDQLSSEIYDEVASQVRLADRLGIDYYWFSEHHAHAHFGHLPTPLLFTLHLAGQTQQIHLGTAIICLNLHHPLDVAEQVAVADLLSKGRISAGFGSGSSPEEFGLFGLPVTGEKERHDRFEEALQIICEAWQGKIMGGGGRYYNVSVHRPLPVAAPSLPSRSWLAVNSAGSARIAGELRFNMMFSHLRTPDQYREYRRIYQEAGGNGLVAANRPIYVGVDDESAAREVEPALRTLWRRFQREGKIASDIVEPESLQELAAHPVNFVFGGPESVAGQIAQLHDYVPFDVLNAEPRWAALPANLVESSVCLLATEVRPRLETISPRNG
jgi:alkanesulfonate monooxygenase SsuD/methylene tetrahydromethanopterin reductase-like flavin-dependent oxidoreductase (luciferase family)